jgi:hypothetical protein
MEPPIGAFIVRREVTEVCLKSSSAGDQMQPANSKHSMNSDGCPAFTISRAIRSTHLADGRMGAEPQPHLEVRGVRKLFAIAANSPLDRGAGHSRRRVDEIASLLAGQRDKLIARQDSPAVDFPRGGIVHSGAAGAVSGSKGQANVGG